MAWRAPPPRRAQRVRGLPGLACWLTGLTGALRHGGRGFCDFWLDYSRSQSLKERTVTLVKRESSIFLLSDAISDLCTFASNLCASLNSLRANCELPFGDNCYLDSSSARSPDHREYQVYPCACNVLHINFTFEHKKETSAPNKTD